MNAATTPPTARRPGGGLNFWQWLGIAIIAIGVLFYLWRNFFAARDDGPRPETSPPPTQAADVAPLAPSTTTAE